MGNKIQHPKKRAFLAAFSHCASISQSAKQARIDRCTHYGWLLEDEAYRKAFELARLQAGDALEDEAARRAFDGSDTLLIFMLKGAKPEKFRDRQEIKHSGDLNITKRLIGIPLDEV